MARLPPGRDPDEVIREDGGAAFRDLLRTAPGFVRFLVGEAHRKRRGRRGPSKAETAREVLEIIAAAPGALEREAWTQEAAGPLGFSLDTALEEVRRLRLRRPPTRAPEAPPAPPPRTEAPRTRVTEAERDLIRWAEEKPVEVAGILRSARRRDLSGLGSADLLLEVKRAADAGAATAAGLLGPAAGTAGTGRMLSRMLKEPVPLHRGQTPQDCWDALRLRELKATLPGLRAALSDPGGDLEKAMRRLEKAVREINRLQEGPSGSRAPGRGKTAAFGAESGRAAPALRLKTDC